MTSALKPRAVLLKQARLLIPRLERLTPDSGWARRASGCRGSLLRLTENLEAHTASGSPPGPDEARDLAALEQALSQGFAILREAARERYL